MVYVKKRNGSKVPYDKQKIVNAINKAFLEVDGVIYEDDTANDIADEILSHFSDTSVIDIELIQDKIEDLLMQSERRDVARAYVRYRYKKEILRQTSKTYDGIMELVELNNDDLKDENSNKNAIVAST